jgi:N-acetylmuramoyl-L-alanine amidase
MQIIIKRWAPKNFFSCIFLGLTLFSGLAWGEASAPFSKLRIPYVIKTILIDPGHGGKDIGAFKNGLIEKQLNLAVAKIVLKNLSQAGFLVKMTRYADNTLQKNERIQLANRMRPDLFISIHANASKHPHAKGVEFFILKDLSTHQDLGSITSRNSRSLYKHLDKNYQAITRKLCRSMEKKFIRIPGVKTRGIKNAGFYLLRNAHCPTVFVEMGFISNAEEADRFKNSAHLEALAHALSQGVVEYCRTQKK